MRIVSLEIRNLYGSMSKDIDFKDELNLLVGINGSGKTSILNVIDWLFHLNLARLSTTKFELLKLTFVHKGETLLLEARQTKRRLLLNLRGHSEREFFPITVDLLENPENINDSSIFDRMLDEYSLLRPEKKEIPLWDFLKKLPKPVVITLDRTITAEADNFIYYDQDYRQRKSKRPPEQNPLEKVKEVTAIRYSQYRSKLIDLNDELKTRIILSALSDPEAKNKKRKSEAMITVEEVEQLEAKVTNYLSTAIRGDSYANQIKTFFNGVQKLVRRSYSFENDSEKEILWGLFAHQYQQIEDLAQAFNTYELDSARAYERLKRYLDQINLFLRDSKKQVFFDEDSNQISFRFLSADGSASGLAQPIERMSSGEKQILILFTFLEFIATSESIFIVDEPELSLHPKWQSDFLDAFLKLKPSSTQILLATHSPEIVGKHKVDCLVLHA